jgi:hypothetical protein
VPWEAAARVKTDSLRLFRETHTPDCVVLCPGDTSYIKSDLLVAPYNIKGPLSVFRNPLRLSQGNGILQPNINTSSSKNNSGSQT